jgi:hypothetical protein
MTTNNAEWLAGRENADGTPRGQCVDDTHYQRGYRAGYDRAILESQGRANSYRAENDAIRARIAELEAAVAEREEAARYFWHAGDPWCEHIHHEPSEYHKGIACPVVTKLKDRWPWLEGGEA